MALLLLKKNIYIVSLIILLAVQLLLCLDYHKNTNVWSDSGKDFSSVSVYTPLL